MNVDIAHPTGAMGGIVLCGGRSSRMGRPKAWLPFGPRGEPMLHRVVARLRLGLGPDAPIAVVAAPDQEIPPPPPGAIVARDPESGRHQGPVRGLATGLAALPESVELVYATGTDVPFLEPAWVRLLLARIGNADLAIARVDGHFHPLAALYRRGPVLRELAKLLDRERLRPIFLMETLPHVVIDEHELRSVDPEARSLRNLNTPEDYQAALDDAKRIGD